jgi:hypothetical protein
MALTLRVLTLPILIHASVHTWDNAHPSLDDCPCVEAKSCPIGSPCYIAFVLPKKQAIKAMGWRDRRRYRKERRNLSKRIASCASCGFGQGKQVSEVTSQPYQGILQYNPGKQSPYPLYYVNQASPSIITQPVYLAPEISPLMLSANRLSEANAAASTGDASQNQRPIPVISEPFSSTPKRKLLVRKTTTYEAIPDPTETEYLPKPVFTIAGSELRASPNREEAQEQANTPISVPT